MSAAKTEDPTPRRLRELRSKGEVPISHRMTSGAALVGAVLAGVSVAPSTLRGLVALSNASLTGAVAPVQQLAAAGALVLASALPVAAGAALAAVVVAGLQTGLAFAPGRIAPDATRFKVGQTWAGRFRFEALVSGALAMIAVVAGSAAAALGVHRLVDAAGELGALAGEGPLAVAEAVGGAALVVAASWFGVSLLLAAVDAAWQRKAFLRRHRMSLQEIRDEAKRSEGDPRHKARRARAHRELLAGDLRSGVARADVVVVNPTHIAIGLRYRPEEVDAPVVTVTGRGERAKAIKRRARAAGVPEYAERRVARAIVTLEVGDEVPDRLFEPVAVIFRWLAEQDGR